MVYTAYLRKVRGHLLHWNYKGHGKDHDPLDNGGPGRQTEGAEMTPILEEDGQ